MSPQLMKLRKQAAVSVVTAALVLSASACGSSSSSAGGGSTAKGNADDQVAAAKAALTKDSAAPTTIPVTIPLTSKPEAGKTLVFLKCDIPSCVALSDGIKEGVEAAGWTYKEIAYKSADPATLASGMKQALNFKPAAVAMSGVPPEAGWASVIPLYKAAGVPIITSYLAGVKYDDTVIADISGPSSFAKSGEIVGNWFIADSGGKGKAVLQRIDDFPVLKTWSDSFASTVKAGCSGCSVVDLNNTVAEVGSGKVLAASISKVRSTPGTNYLISSLAEVLDGVDAALASAGLTGKVKFAGNNPSVGQLQLLKEKKGSERAFPGLALRYSGWSIVDVALRHSEGMQIDPENGGLPTQLLLPGGDFKVDSSYDQPADFRDQFKKLWQVG